MFFFDFPCKLQPLKKQKIALVFQNCVSTVLKTHMKKWATHTEQLIKNHSFLSRSLNNRSTIFQKNDDFLVIPLTVAMNVRLPPETTRNDFLFLLYWGTQRTLLQNTVYMRHGACRPWAVAQPPTAKRDACAMARGRPWHACMILLKLCFIRIF